MNLAEFLSIPKRCILIVVDEANMKASVNYTTSPGLHLAGLYSELNGRGATLELFVVSAGADIETLKLHTEYYRSYYQRIGYEELRPKARKAIQYRVRAVPALDIKGIDVELVSARGEVRVVGKFRNMGDAKSFIETYYGTDNSFKLPVYAINADTKAFMLDKQTKLLELK